MMMPNTAPLESPLLLPLILTSWSKGICWMEPEEVVVWQVKPLRYPLGTAEFTSHALAGQVSTLPCRRTLTHPSLLMLTYPCTILNNQTKICSSIPIQIERWLVGFRLILEMNRQP